MIYCLVRSYVLLTTFLVSRYHETALNQFITPHNFKYREKLLSFTVYETNYKEVRG